MQTSYFDISKIITAKTERRHALAALTWELKVSIIEQMRQILPQKMWRDKITNEKALHFEQNTHHQHEK